MTPGTPLLFDTNLQTCPDAWLAGLWHVRRRSFGPPGPFSQAQALLLEAETGTLTLVSADQAQHPGHWGVERDPLLGRPYLTLTTPHAHTRALVTRLRRSNDGAAAALSLYLQDGTELELVYDPAAETLPSNPASRGALRR